MEVGDGSTVVLGNGQDTVTAGANTNIALGNGIDLVTTGSTSTVTLGNGNGDTVYSGGESTITVGNGNDTIYVGTADTIKVGSGNDTFIFGQTTSGTIGKVTINNFSATHDVIQIASALGSWDTSFATLSPHITNVSGSAVIALDASGDTITLVGVQASALHASDFHFA